MSMHQLDALWAHGAVRHQHVAAGGAGARAGWAQLIQTRQLLQSKHTPAKSLMEKCKFSSFMLLPIMGLLLKRTSNTSC